MPPASPWRPGPHAPILNSNEVHVWRAVLEAPPAQVAALQGTLSADERARAEAFRRARDRDHFIVARGLLRCILARYAHDDPRALCFRYNTHGKPALLDGGDDLRFNVSHARGLALYALARGREVGVDLEWVRQDIAGEEIAARFFSAREARALRALPAPQRQGAFFRCWTRKEAYVKARGLGLALALDSFDVSLAPGESAALLHTRPDPSDATRWTLHDLHPGADYVAALAVEGRMPHHTFCYTCGGAGVPERVWPDGMDA